MFKKSAVFLGFQTLKKNIENPIFKFQHHSNTVHTIHMEIIN